MPNLLSIIKMMETKTEEIELSPSHTGSSMPNDDRRTITQYIISKQNADSRLACYNYAFLKKISKCVKFGTKSTHFEKKTKYFQSALISAILTHFEKISKIKFCMARFIFIV